MTDTNKQTSQHAWKSFLSSLPMSINDLRDKAFAGEQLTGEQKQALHQYDQYRIHILNSANTEAEFHQRYQEMQAKANLSPYQEFLKVHYNTL